MPHRSKRYQVLAKEIDKNKVYSLEETLALVRKTSNIKFDASVEIHIRLGIDPKKGEQQVRSTVVLPHGIGKSKTICVFAEGDKAKEAEKAGADLVGGEELIEKIKKTGKCDFELALATPDMMPKLAIIAKTLGPKGLMPSPKNETITPNIGKAVEEMKKGKIAFKNDDTANIHQVIGKVSFDDVQLTENFKTFMEALEKSKPETSKGTFIKSVSMTTTMGPGIKVDYQK
ncbi:50S ribosomal protein L1 [Candidatus Falkowbacteria bacterium RIFOXYD2_FULL_35_9]|uniref:Large ribosomal subunit protein uL1 n=1 Tax=Candidatus Falkowbacteria bacterium RIFOXYC2_FULL_36_12 TaxID=1798002 RepID=A0A1F5SZN2_9BACT|nr:MAG: 50S ribosomal protein L1 [Candidatus Falkowbacteria bacterium RIFOXYB2_FULL_35_7]OGF31923.1 MAG: 50S ribosomal protein L1 [Candidatus Falkowbacteria bacterium RIFOXYC2_FULL_36_12]OGF33804.1 MAG: 50S ribosomal protein L1 [Candidatus Falkowbacteria bacterium RIFOXYA2_FULL_35_8]OGF46312.1 MAG: 50S ribosomal protein L1 [Candidatus Falkowbacteria bacterium RIFOXYD2_FULL_35_9]